MGASELTAHLHGGAPEPELQPPALLQAEDPVVGMRVILHQSEPPLRDYAPVGFGAGSGRYRVSAKHPQRELWYLQPLGCSGRGAARRGKWHPLERSDCGRGWARFDAGGVGPDEIAPLTDFDISQLPCPPRERTPQPKRAGARSSAAKAGPASRTRSRQRREQSGCPRGVAGEARGPKRLCVDAGGDGAARGARGQGVAIPREAGGASEGAAAPGPKRRRTLGPGEAESDQSVQVRPIEPVRAAGAGASSAGLSPRRGPVHGKRSRLAGVGAPPQAPPPRRRRLQHAPHRGLPVDADPQRRDPIQSDVLGDHNAPT